jgi:hypothetical protein
VETVAGPSPDEPDPTSALNFVETTLSTYGLCGIKWVGIVIDALEKFGFGRSWGVEGD